VLSHDVAASRLQSRYRGFHVRKKTWAAAAAAPSRELGGAARASCSVIEAEDLLLQQPAFETPDLVERQFLSVDPAKKGCVQADAFYQVMEGQTGNSLSRSELEVLRKTFEDSKAAAAAGGDHVNWREFLRFATFRPPPLGGAQQTMRSMILSVREETAFEQYDPQRKGTVTRANFTKVLDSFGLGLGKHIMADIAHLFDLYGDHSVHYRLFMAYVLEQPSVARLHRVEAKLKAVLLGARERGVHMKDAFKAFDSSGNGVVSLTEFRNALATLNLELDGREMRVLYHRIAPGRREISVHDFVTFVEAPSTAAAAAAGTARGGGGGGVVVVRVG
jgi:Ca2+-binding EF-hand superfamily protein